MAAAASWLLHPYARPVMPLARHLPRNAPRNPLYLVADLLVDLTRLVDTALHHLPHCVQIRWHACLDLVSLRDRRPL
jgi:hypothetical protein